MSSAILYLAIIAIWACVLIPRWLRRDSTRGGATFTPSETAAQDETETDFALPDAPDKLASPDPADGAVDAHDTRNARRRVLAARRRLLWMMLGLEAAGGTLAVTSLAAWWVIAPPTVMLVGYLLVLRAAAQADAERDARERGAAQAAQVRARERARRAHEARKAAAAQLPAATAAPRVAFAAAPVPEDYEDLGHGRDFTPGLRYASPSSGAPDEDAYDQYTENRLRAVGD